MTSAPRPPERPQPVYEDLELHVDLEPVRRLRDRETQEEFVVSRRLAGCVLFLVGLVVAGVLGTILLTAWLTAPRGASDAPPQGVVVEDRRELPGAPHVSGSRSLGLGSNPSGGAPLAAVSGIQSGSATWYCGNGSPCTRGYGPSDLVAAIDPSLGIAKGERVTVRSQAGSGQVTVTIVDVCACGGARLIDLTTGAFRRLAPLEYGVIPVTIEVAGETSTLPPTETEP